MLCLFEDLNKVALNGKNRENEKCEIAQSTAEESFFENVWVIDNIFVAISNYVCVHSVFFELGG